VVFIEKCFESIQKGLGYCPNKYFKASGCVQGSCSDHFWGMGNVGNEQLGMDSLISKGILVWTHLKKGIEIKNQQGLKENQGLDLHF
jgi:hypothetical protein